MWSSNVTHIKRLIGPICALSVLAACTVEPLNGTSSSRISNDGTSQSVRTIMKSTSVAPVSTRVGQQVRNNLLFELNGGQLVEGGEYRVTLNVTSASRSLAIERDSLTPTSSQAVVSVTYRLVKSDSGDVISEGTRRAVASYDQTPQKFANERALRDAQNRAAKEVALYLRLAIGQALTKAQG